MALEHWTLEMDGPGPKEGRVEWVLFERPPTPSPNTTHNQKNLLSLFLPKKQKYYYYNREKRRGANKTGFFWNDHVGL